jgi:hypothetical protein
MATKRAASKGKRNKGKRGKGGGSGKGGWSRRQRAVRRQARTAKTVKGRMRGMSRSIAFRRRAAKGVYKGGKLGAIAKRTRTAYTRLKKWRTIRRG